MRANSWSASARSSRSSTVNTPLCTSCVFASARICCASGARSSDSSTALPSRMMRSLPCALRIGSTTTENGSWRALLGSNFATLASMRTRTWSSSFWRLVTEYDSTTPLVAVVMRSFCSFSSLLAEIAQCTFACISSMRFFDVRSSLVAPTVWRIASSSAFSIASGSVLPMPSTWMDCAHSGAVRARIAASVEAANGR